MTHYVGLDASKATTSICVLNKQGEIVSEGAVPTEPAAIKGFLRGQGRRYSRVGIEATSFTPWLYEGLARAGLPLVCIDPRHAHEFLKTARLNKTDRNDARGIAEMMRGGHFKAVHIKTQASQTAKLILAAQRHIVRQRRNLDNLIRGALLQYGLKLHKHQLRTFDRRANSLLPASGPVREVLAGLLVVRQTLVEQIKTLDAQIAQLADEDEACRLFMTVPGVGPRTALTFRSAIDVPQRFQRPRTVAVHLGLTPAAYRSGTIDRAGRISRCGDKATRTALVIAAMSVLSARTRASELQAWGNKVVASRGYMKGVVAVARRLSVLLLRMWLSRTDAAGISA